MRSVYHERASRNNIEGVKTDSPSILPPASIVGGEEVVKLSVEGILRGAGWHGLGQGQGQIRGWRLFL